MCRRRRAAFRCTSGTGRPRRSRCSRAIRRSTRSLSGRRPAARSPWVRMASATACASACTIARLRVRHVVLKPTRARRRRRHAPVWRGRRRRCGARARRPRAGTRARRGGRAATGRPSAGRSRASGASSGEQRFHGVASSTRLRRASRRKRSSSSACSDCAPHATAPSITRLSAACSSGAPSATLRSASRSRSSCESRGIRRIAAAPGSPQRMRGRSAAILRRPT